MLRITIFGGFYRIWVTYHTFFRHPIVILSITADCHVTVFGCIIVTKYIIFIVFKSVIGPITVIKCKIVIICIIINGFDHLVGVS